MKPFQAKQDFAMSKNARIREHLAATCADRRSKNRFMYGHVEIIIDHDSPVKGVDFVEYIRVSVYNPKSDKDMVFCVPVSEVEFIENALTE